MTHQAELSAKIARWNDGAQDALRGYNRVSPSDPDYNEGYDYVTRGVKVDAPDLAIGALKEFLAAARYQPHMSGKPSFIGWQQGQLRHAETCAREALDKMGIAL